MCFPDLTAYVHTWKKLAAADFTALQTLCLKPSQYPGKGWDCPRRCGCRHAIIFRHDRTAPIALCCCDTPACPDIPLTLEQITPLQVDFPKLGRAVARAFQCEPRFAHLGLPFTVQVGSWSAAAVPVIFTSQVDGAPFRQVVAELAATTLKPFILFAPTAHFIDTRINQLLSTARAAFFDLASHTMLTSQGTLLPTKTPGELFAQFTPQPQPAEEDRATQIMTVVTKLDSQTPSKPPSLITVFRLYCIDGLSATHIAKKFHCSKPTILRRLNLLTAAIGESPDHLRRFSPHLAKLEQSLSDPRARSINRKRALYGDDPDDDQ